MWSNCGGFWMFSLRDRWASALNYERNIMATIIENPSIALGNNGIKIIPGSGALVRGEKGVYFVFRNPITKTLQCSCGRYCRNVLQKKYKEPCQHIERVVHRFSTSQRVD